MVERWERVKELFEAALDKPAAARAAFLAAQCGGDTALRSEVESLIGEYERLGSFLNKPAAAEAAETILFSRSDGLRSSRQTEASEPVFLGQEISHYKVHEQIGSGGMGAVYRAEDLASRREVALKFLTKGANAEKNALERFRREARIAESLIHPNICAFYEIDEAAGVPFISMELLHGQTIHQSIFRKAATGTGILDDTPFVPVNVPDQDGRAFDAPTLLRICVAVLNGLHAAHLQDVVHRDVKPANIFLTRNGRVKILDFGLAKRFMKSRSGVNTDGITKAGTALGTLTYMSPEQIRGERVDARSDLFSFGAVMFEMATGRRAFEGRYLGQVLESIVKNELPAAHEIRPEIPVMLSDVITKAMEKDRDRRYGSAAEMRADVETVIASLKASRN